MDRETKTVRLMIKLCCQKHHGSKKLCDNCRALADYCAKRMARCPFGVDKPACSDCTVHCFKPDMRAKIIEVMRYSGPRMVWYHPLLALRHLRRKNGFRRRLIS
jgi:hypothetical protein